MNLINLEYYKHICEYYDVDVLTAVALGTRKDGRKPALPQSETCNAVSGKTYEDIWNDSNRSTLEGVFNFYKDQGAWSTFRQMVRHQDMEKFHLSILNHLVKSGSHICEYGCGVAPFSASTLKNMPNTVSLDISLADVESEHLKFGRWRLDRIIGDKKLNAEVKEYIIKPNELPKFNKKIDVAIVFEVFEHVPSPIETTNNLILQMNPGAYFIENFIYHDDDHAHDGSDLQSAAAERSQYYALLEEKMDLFMGDSHRTHHNSTRVWRVK